MTPRARNETAPAAAGTLQMLRAKIRHGLAQLPYLPRALALVWTASRGWTVAWAILLLAQGVLPAAIVTLTRSLVNSLVAVAGKGFSWDRLRPTLILAVAMGGAMLLTEVLRSVTSLVRTAQSELIRDHIANLVHDKSVDIDLAFYESPEGYDLLFRARSEAGSRPIDLLESLGSLFQNGVTLVAMAAILLPYGLWLPAVLVVSTLPAFLVVLRYNLRQYDWQRRRTPDERRSWYYDWIMTSRETAAEVRLFRLGDRFRADFQALRKRLRGERLALARGQGLARLGAVLVALLATAGVLLWMVWRSLQGSATLGDLALFYQAFSQGQGLLRALLEGIAQVYASTVFMGNLFEFLEIKPQIVDPVQPTPAPVGVHEAIRFCDVDFRYPGSGRLALEGFGLVIPAGKVTAIVGPNGAGKSTLIKLLCRFYDPERGHVEIDGVDLRAMPVEALRQLVTVLFQEPVHYHDTVAGNIAMGDLSGNAGRERIVAAAEAAGADAPVAHLPQGYDTLLGRWFADGHELSVGEWQRIALARAFLRQSPLIILDEPTSAMDSWAEADWLARFRQFAAGRTAIIVTHRFTTAMHADVIHVMDDGRVVETGTHAELVTRGGLYAESWERQMAGLTVEATH